MDAVIVALDTPPGAPFDTNSNNTHDLKALENEKWPLRATRRLMNYKMIGAKERPPCADLSETQSNVWIRHRARPPF
jgi:hypothetical protein